MKIGINGFGRIGRAVARQIIKNDQHEIIIVNDPNMSVENMSYLLQHDSIYGVMYPSYNDLFDFYGIEIYQDQDGLSDFNLDGDVDIIIDTSGDFSKWENTDFPGKVLITNIPDEYCYDFLLTHGVNEASYDHRKHKIISCGTCDANAVAPILYSINKVSRINWVKCITLHPFLSYQNLLDNSAMKMPWNDFSLGRSAVSNLIIKETTTMSSVQKVLPYLKDVQGFSYRIPTSIVSNANLFIGVDVFSGTNFRDIIRNIVSAQSNIFGFNTEDRVSIDYKGTTQSVWIDGNYINFDHKNNILQLVLWYDNEWSYASRIIDTINLISEKGKS